MKNQNVLISGASIAGPALAYWLRRHGFTPTVVERAAAPRPAGSVANSSPALFTSTPSPIWRSRSGSSPTGSPRTAGRSRD